MSLQEKEAYDLAKCRLAEYLKDSAVCSMDEYVQHGTTGTLKHCISIVHISCAMAEKLHIRVNYENLIVGALLHDFYLYDWHTHQDEGVLHGFAHPHIACRNAAMRFHVNAEVQHIITTHMWPLTLRFARFFSWLRQGDYVGVLLFQRGGSGLHGGQVLFYPRDRGGIFPRCRCTAPKKAGVSLWYIIFLTM